MKCPKYKFVEFSFLREPAGMLEYSRWNRLAFIALVVFHFFVLLGNTIACFMLPFFAPWYIALPLISFLVRIGFEGNEDKCPLTNAENQLRIKMGKPPINSFIKYYITDKLIR